MTETTVVRIESDLLPVIRKYSDGSVSDGIRAMQKLIAENSEKMMSPDEVAATVRTICQVEGVMLHDRQKSFFREIFASLTKCISDKGLMRE